MADNIQLNSGASGDVLAADEVGGLKFQRVKIAHGADGVATEVTSSAPFPVSQASDGAVNLSLSRYLDTIGDGLGTKNANGNYSSVQGIFRLAPPAATIFRVFRLIVCAQDTTGMTAQEYGNIGAALANGIQVRVHNGSTTVVDLTDGLPITSNAEWARVCFDVDVKSWGTGDELLAARWTFSKFGVPIRLDGDATEELQVLLDDDLTGLLGHYFLAQGYTEGSPT